MSSFYYAALAAKLVVKGATKHSYQSGVEVVKKLEALRDDPAASSKNVTNAVRLHTILQLLFGAANMPHVECLIARDWLVAGLP